MLYEILNYKHQMIQMQLTFKMISRFKFKHRGILFFKAVHFLLIRVYEFKIKISLDKREKGFSLVDKFKLQTENNESTNLR